MLALDDLQNEWRWRIECVRDEVTRRRGGWGIPPIDATAIRVALGFIDFPDATHNEVGRIAYCFGWLAGLWGHPEHYLRSDSGPTGRADVAYSTLDEKPVAVVEVKSARATRDAVRQVDQYREWFGCPHAAVVAPAFVASSWCEGAQRGVLLLRPRELWPFTLEVAAAFGAAPLVAQGLVDAS